MIQPIMHDPLFLAQKSAPATPEDAPVARDLLETLYEAEEGCLSLEGVRKAKRYQSIKVQYQTMDGKPRIKTFTGWTAQIIQHEIDHCDGILI